MVTTLLSREPGALARKGMLRMLGGRDLGMFAWARRHHPEGGAAENRGKAGEVGSGCLKASGKLRLESPKAV